MNTKPAASNRSRAFQPLAFAMVLVAAACGTYVGVRWHRTIEGWFGVATAGDSSSTANPSGATQLWTCGMHPQVIQDHPGDCPICHMKLTPLVTSAAVGAEEGAAAKDGAGVSIDPRVVQNMGVRTAQVTDGPLQRIIRVTASVKEAETSQYEINLRVSGWIQTLYANTDGMEVKKNDPLFDLYSPDLRLAIEELISARRAADAAGVGQSTHDMGTSLVRAAGNRLVALGLTPEQVSQFGAMEQAPSIITFLSPIDGHVTDKSDASAGSAVMSGQRILRLSQRSTMWVEGRVPEGLIGNVKVGQKATATVDAFPGQVFEGEVVFIHPHLDAMTRTALVRMSVRNDADTLRDGMYASISIESGSADRVTLVPREAIIDTGETQIVFISDGDGRFEPRKVAMGRSADHGLVEVTSGLAPGETVVASGQFLLDSESRLREAIAKFMTQQTAAPVAHSVLATAPLQVDAVVAAYLPIAESLGAMQESEAPISVEPLISAVHALHAAVASPEATRLITTAAEAAGAMKGQPIEQQRESFKSLSAAVIAIVDAIPPSPAVADSLYVLNCPMAKADWLQRTKGIANPYYADYMKECGTVVRPVGTKGAR